jgi:hypothetical protein
MADNSWEPTPPPVDTGETLAAQVGGVFGTAEMQAALPTNGNENGKPETPAGWVQATPYNYESYSKDAAHDWECNAKTYEWDGEVGDIGPEFPALEIELFGEPGNRAKQGIDFSKYVNGLHVIVLGLLADTTQQLGSLRLSCSRKARRASTPLRPSRMPAFTRPC